MDNDGNTKLAVAFRRVKVVDTIAPVIVCLECTGNMIQIESTNSYILPEVTATDNYDGDLTFAFDNIADYELIHSKLKLIRKHAPTKNIKFYVLVGFESTDAQDIENAFKRIGLLMQA